MAVFKLDSDKQFIRTIKGDPDIYVFEYLDDPNVFEMIRASNSRWQTVTRVGVSSRAMPAPFKELEVLGVTIRGDRVKDLANDLTLAAPDGQSFHLIVNRQGLCFVYVGSQSVMRLRVNDYFGWSKYGVNLTVGTVWNRWDMNNGAVLVGPATTASASGDDEEARWCCKKLVEEKDKVLEEKEKEIAALKAAMKALVQEM